MQQRVGFSMTLHDPDAVGELNMVDKHRVCANGWLGGPAKLTGQMQGKLQFATVRHVAVVSHVMLMGFSDLACRGFAHPEVCKNPDPLLLFGSQSEPNSYHRECSCMMRMCVTRLSKRANKGEVSES